MGIRPREVRKQAQADPAKHATVAGYLVVVAARPELAFPASLQECYRLSWQVESVVKRFRSVAQLERMQNSGNDSSE